MRVIRSLVVIDNNVVHQSEQIVQEILQHDRVHVTARGKRAISVLFCDEESKASISGETENETRHIQVHQTMASPSPNSLDRWED